MAYRYSVERNFQDNKGGYVSDADPEEVAEIEDGDFIFEAAMDLPNGTEYATGLLRGERVMVYREIYEA